MHGDTLSPDAEYYRLQYAREVAHRRLVAQALADDRHHAPNKRYRLAHSFVLMGDFLHGTVSQMYRPARSMWHRFSV